MPEPKPGRKAAIDPSVSARLMYRPNARAGSDLAHLLLRPAIERGIPDGDADELVGWLARFRADLGWIEPEACRAVGEKRSAAHILALHCVGTLATPPLLAARLGKSTAWLALQRNALEALKHVRGILANA